MSDVRAQMFVFPTPYERAKALQLTMHCCCDLDNWEPERVPYTGHSHVCCIHKAVLVQIREEKG